MQIKVPEDGRRLVITAVRSGSTTLLLIYGNGKQETILINVYARSPQAIRTELKTLLAGLTGVDIREVGGRMFLDGAVPSQDDLARIDRIVALYAGQVASLVTVDPARQRTNIKLDLHFVQFRKNSSLQVRRQLAGQHRLAPQRAAAAVGELPLHLRLRLASAATQGQMVIAENLLPSLDILGHARLGQDQQRGLGDHHQRRHRDLSHRRRGQRQDRRRRSGSRRCRRFPSACSSRCSRGSTRSRA